MILDPTIGRLRADFAVGIEQRLEAAIARMEAIPAFLAQRRETVPLRRQGRNFVGLCPFHAEKTPSFGVDVEKKLYHCFGCQAGGDVFEFVMRIEGISFREALLLLAKEVQQFALTAFGITAAVHLAVVILRDLIQSRNRWANLTKAIGGVVLAVLIVSGGLAFSAVLGGDFAWNVIWTARTFILTDHDIGLNLKTLMRLLLILVVLAVFLWTIRKDLKAVLKKA